MGQSLQVRAAPHPAAATFSSYSDGQKGACRGLSVLPATLPKPRCRRLSPRHLRGEMLGRAMRGGADIDSRSIQTRISP
ncbi:MAG: hypothetical protein EOR48_10180 [Mesorhizobium sp.]|nr:MAG: hypothetical protein EOR48_10180 [Mesorhizobium sp.]TIP40338.1 MAG: hypothetical protein E5X62_28855 [Mesorhizobium sp.]